MTVMVLVIPHPFWLRRGHFSGGDIFHEQKVILFKGRPFRAKCSPGVCSGRGQGAGDSIPPPVKSGQLGTNSDVQGSALLLLGTSELAPGAAPGATCIANTVLKNEC